MPYTVTLPDRSYEFICSMLRQAETASRKTNKGMMITSITNALAAMNEAVGTDVTPKPAVVNSHPRIATIEQVAQRVGCIEHPKYTAMRRPRTDCKGCWNMYSTAHPDRI